MKGHVIAKYWHVVVDKADGLQISTIKYLSFLVGLSQNGGYRIPMDTPHIA